MDWDTQKHKFLSFTVEQFITHILKFRTFLWYLRVYFDIPVSTSKIESRSLASMSTVGNHIPKLRWPDKHLELQTNFSKVPCVANAHSLGGTMALSCEKSGQMLLEWGLHRRKRMFTFSPVFTNSFQSRNLNMWLHFLSSPAYWGLFNILLK